MKDFQQYFIPTGLDEVERHYGDPNGPLSQAATISLPEPIGGVTSLKCHAKAAPAIRLFFARIQAENLWHCLRFIGPCYDPGVDGVLCLPTMHARGAALTINLPLNPHGENAPLTARNDLAKNEFPGKVLFPTHPIVKIAKEMGFSWLGDNVDRPQPAEFTIGHTND